MRVSALNMTVTMYIRCRIRTLNHLQPVARSVAVRTVYRTYSLQKLFIRKLLNILHNKRILPSR